MTDMNGFKVCGKRGKSWIKGNGVSRKDPTKCEDGLEPCFATAITEKNKDFVHCVEKGK